MGRDTRKPAGITVLGRTFLVLVIPSLFFALIAMISGAYNIRGPLDRFMDIFMRLLWIGTPLALAVSGIGLLVSFKWARALSLITGAVLTLESFIFGMLGFFANLKEHALFGVILSGVCFFVALLFGRSVRYLTSQAVRDYFRNLARV